MLEIGRFLAMEASSNNLINSTQYELRSFLFELVTRVRGLSQFLS